MTVFQEQQRTYFQDAANDQAQNVPNGQAQNASNDQAEEFGAADAARAIMSLRTANKGLSSKAKGKRRAAQ